MRAGKLVGDLRRDGEQRFLIEVGVGDRQQQVGRAGAERGNDHTRLLLQLAIDRGGESGVGFMPHQDEIDARLAQFVDQDQDFATG